jgi:hypothetical protein
MRTIGLTILAVGLLAATPGSATADQTVPQSQSVALQSTDWASNLVFNKFDSTLGTLTGVEFTLTGHLQGTAAYENTAYADATVNLLLRAVITLGSTPTTAITTVTLVSATTDHAGPFDGTIDFAGTSGKTYGALSADKSVSVVLSDAASLALFTGTGSILLPISAIGTSAASGLGNLLTRFSTSASSSATLVYDYAPPTNPSGQDVPEPTSLVLAACGGLGLLVLSRRRRGRTS